MKLILASTSRYRRELLERLGVPFVAVAPLVDEDDYKMHGLDPRVLAETLAREKALNVAARFRDAVVIGSDQVAVLDGLALGKPGSIDNAISQLQAMSGRAHDLVTAIAVIYDGGLIACTNVTRLVMRPLTSDEIRRYVETDLPLDCAGSYKLESRGIALFQSIESDDHTAIVGMPLIALTTILRNVGFAVP